MHLLASLCRLTLVLTAVSLLPSCSHHAEIPDANFRAYLKGQFPSAFDEEKLNTQHPDIMGCTELHMIDKGITSLKGLEFFPALATLDCSLNQLTSLDISQNTALTTLNCATNQLAKLDINKNAALTTLNCAGNQLIKLDINKNKALVILNCQANQLTSLDVSKNKALRELWCGYNQLKTLDVRQNTALNTLSCYSNQLTSLDISQNAALVELLNYNNPLTKLDVSHNKALTLLEVDHNQLTSLDVSQNPALTFLDCADNQLTSLDVSQNPMLTHLECNDNATLHSVDLRGMRKVDNLYFVRPYALEHAFPQEKLKPLDPRSLTLLAASMKALSSLKIHNNLQNRDEVKALKQTRGAALSIETYTSPDSTSIAYIKTCANYDPLAKNGQGSCLR